MLTSDDPTYVIAPPFYWSVIEANMGVLAASIPSFKPLAKRFLPRLIGESSQKNSRTYTNNGSYSRGGGPRHYGVTSSSGGGGGGGFNKLGSAAAYEDAMRMKVFERDMDDTIGMAIPGDNLSKRSEATSTTSEMMHHDTTMHSNDSEEAIIMKPRQGDIVMTTEFTRTFEERPKNKRVPSKDYYPGRDGL